MGQFIAGDPSVTDPGQIQVDEQPGQLAKGLIKDALIPVQSDLEELSCRLRNYVPTDTKSGRDVLEYIFRAGGKRIRPALYFMACRVLGYKGDHYFPIAAVGEFVHTASLLHDDVVDSSTIRRGKPTANTQWGDQSSVLVGDLIYATASEMMAATGNIEIVKTFAQAIRTMSDGELLQLESVFNADLPESTYMQILESKTAILIEAVCKSAALLAGSSEEICRRLARFGHCVGMAFQLIDDALDFVGAEEILGKDTLLDIQEGKVTLPTILCLRRCSEEEKTIIRNVFSKDVIERNDAAKVAKLVERYETVDETIAHAHKYTTEALDHLHSFPESEARNDLENLANKLLFRFN